MTKEFEKLLEDWNSIFPAYGILNEVFMDSDSMIPKKVDKVEWNQLENDDDDNLTFEINVIGIDPELVKVTVVNGNVIKVTGPDIADDDYRSSFTKDLNATFKVPSTHKAKSASALIAHGVLTIGVSKRTVTKDKEIHVEY